MSKNIKVVMLLATFMVVDTSASAETTFNLMQSIANPSLLVERSRQLIMAQRCMKAGKSIGQMEVSALTSEVTRLAGTVDEASRDRAKAEVDYGPQALIDDFNCEMLKRELDHRAHPPSDDLPF